MAEFEWISAGGVTSAAGFAAGAVAAGVKYAQRLDLALLVSERDCAAAGLFTRSQVAAAPVLVDREMLQANPAGIRAIVANAGNANACTGRPGLTNARLTQTIAAFALGCEFRQVLLLSTGVIGVQLPMDRIEAGVRAAAAALSPAGGAQAARAILTTDTRPKEAAVRVRLSGGEVTIGGMAKGAGMIHPDMATMLAVVTTDAAVAPAALQTALRQAADASFNRISVDGDTSTNDSVLLLANGASGVAAETAVDLAAFTAALTQVCAALAQAIVRDGEGARKFVEIRVSGAPDTAAAHAIANTIATSPLVKTALAGSDANWGRILAAAGRAGVPFAQADAALWVANPGGTPLQLVAAGTPTPYAEADAAAIFAASDILIHLDVGAGTAETVVWTCDLTHEYVSINADYRT